MATALEGTESAAQAISRVRYTHDAMIDLVIAKPEISQNEIAKHFGFSVGWVSRVFCSDAFQARLAERRTELVDPTLIATIDEKLKAVVSTSLDIVQEKLSQSRSLDVAFKALEIGAKAVGYGARSPTVQNTFVVAMPQQAASAADWASKHTGGQVYEVKPAEA